MSFFSCTAAALTRGNAVPYYLQSELGVSRGKNSPSVSPPEAEAMFFHLWKRRSITKSCTFLTLSLSHITEKADFLFSLIYHKPLGQYAVYDHIHPWLKNIIIGAIFTHISVAFTFSSIPEAVQNSVTGSRLPCRSS